MHLKFQNQVPTTWQAWQFSLWLTWLPSTTDLTAGFHFSTREWQYDWCGLKPTMTNLTSIYSQHDSGQQAWLTWSLTTSMTTLTTYIDQTALTSATDHNWPVQHLHQWPTPLLTMKTMTDATTDHDHTNITSMSNDNWPDQCLQRQLTRPLTMTMTSLATFLHFNTIHRGGMMQNSPFISRHG